MKRKLVLLVSSAGRRVELIECFRRDAEGLGIRLRVLATDSEPSLSSACQVADAAFRAPRCSEPAFIPYMLGLCRGEGVDLLIPTIDPELTPYAGARELFEQSGTRVMISSSEFVAIARDKLRTATTLSAHKIHTPRTVVLAALLAGDSDIRYPVILKRRDGSSSIGLHEVGSLAEAQAFSLDPGGYVAQEKLPGTEYTVNVFFDVSGRFRAAVPHIRLETRAGEVSKGVTRRHPYLSAVAAQLEGAIGGAQGAICFQAMVSAEDEGGVFEINARFGGGFPLAHRAGARFTQWLLEEAAGTPCSANDHWLGGVKMLRYDAAVFRHGDEAV